MVKKSFRKNPVGPHVPGEIVRRTDPARKGEVGLLIKSPTWEFWQVLAMGQIDTWSTCNFEGLTT